jgi:PPOX class probable F420-dependent enzyme
MTAHLWRGAGYSHCMAHTTIPDSHRDLLEGDVLTLATAGEDGCPQLSEVWFLVEDGQIAMSLNTNRQKVKNIETEPACAVLLLDLQNPYRYLEIRGTAVVAPDEDRAFAEKVGAKYHSDLREHDAPGDRRVIVRIVPVRVNAVDLSG